jgi:hypothetical protein
VIAGRHRNHATLSLAIRQQRQPVRRSALFERAGHLQIIQLQNRVCASRARHCIAGKRRRANHSTGYSLGRRSDVGKAQHVSRT